MPKNFEREYVLGSTSFINKTAGSVKVEAARIVVLAGGRFGVQLAGDGTTKLFGISSRPGESDGALAVVYRDGEIVNVELDRRGSSDAAHAVAVGDSIGSAGAGFAEEKSTAGQSVGYAATAFAGKPTSASPAYIAVVVRPH